MGGREIPEEAGVELGGGKEISEEAGVELGGGGGFLKRQG